MYWPFRDVWWACSDSSIIRQFDATKKFASTPSGRGGYSGEFSYPLWGNEAYWEYYAHGRAVLLVEIRPAAVTPKRRRIRHALSPTICETVHCVIEWFG